MSPDPRDHANQTTDPAGASGTDPTVAPDDAAVAKRPSGKRVLLVIGLLAIALGVVAFLRYRSSEQHILAALLRIKAQGARLSTEQCVDHVVDWVRHCRAMASLCESSAPRLMKMCLSRKDRRPYCNALTQSTEDTRFGYHECMARGARKGLPKKACAMAYRTIDVHCHELSVAAKSAALSTRPGDAP